jgi:2-dehydro-3-deoxyphosphooctonate aldolase (KDO 8-P synthase)
LNDRSQSFGHNGSGFHKQLGQSQSKYQGDLKSMKTARVGSIEIGNTPLPVLIAGPCVIESESHAIKMAGILTEIALKNGFEYIFKTSFDKANRSSIHSYRGPGLKDGLVIIEKIKSKFSIPVLTDIHDISQIRDASQVVDIIQIPAFLCRQTDLYVEAGKYPVAVNVKKGQFIAPDEVKNIIEKARHANISNLTLTERGTSFGYHRLVVDFVAMAQIRDFGIPIIFDGTHALQQPGGGGTFTAGNRDFVPHLCRAAAAVGCDGIFLEVHHDPDQALCDGPNMITPKSLESILSDIKSIVGSMK